jgi:hypothetical protein
MLYAPLWLWIGCVMIYAYVTNAYELIVFSAGIDAFYNTAHTIPFMMCIVSSIVLVMLFIKPYFSKYVVS